MINYIYFLDCVLLTIVVIMSVRYWFYGLIIEPILRAKRQKAENIKRELQDSQRRASNFISSGILISKRF